jgi:hypothetical protein
MVVMVAAVCNGMLACDSAALLGSRQSRRLLLLTIGGVCAPGDLSELRFGKEIRIAGKGTLWIHFLTLVRR